MKRPQRYLAIAAVLAAAATSFAESPTDAVVRLTSHGASGVVVYSTNRRTLILTAGHAFAGELRARPIIVDAVGPAAPGGADGRAARRVVAVDTQTDLAVVELLVGPLPHVCPVARTDPDARTSLLSVGYDAMRWPATVESASLTSITADVTFTRERPRPGRSGGPLIDTTRGNVVGIVSGYETSGMRRGVYASRSACVRILGVADQAGIAPYSPGRWDGQAVGIGCPFSQPQPPESFAR